MIERNNINCDRGNVRSEKLHRQNTAILFRERIGNSRYRRITPAICSAVWDIQLQYLTMEYISQMMKTVCSPPQFTPRQDRDKNTWEWIFQSPRCRETFRARPRCARELQQWLGFAAGSAHLHRSYSFFPSRFLCPIRWQVSTESSPSQGAADM